MFVDQIYLSDLSNSVASYNHHLSKQIDKAPVRHAKLIQNSGHHTRKHHE